MAEAGLQVVIADDHALIRQGLVALLRLAEPGWSLREAATLAELRARLAKAPCGLAVLDLRMPGMEGRASLCRLRAEFPRLRLVVLSGIDDRAAILDCLAAGAHGYVLKTAPTACLLHALRQVAGGEVYVPPELAWCATPPASAPALFPDLPRPNFTSRQQDVLALLAEGRSTKDIARALNLGVGTVKVHLSAIYRALGVRNRMEAVLRLGPRG